MCEEHAIERLMSFNFVGIVDEVEGSLSFKARNADPRVQPFYSRILYTWYVTHGDYRNGGPTMLRFTFLLLTYSSAALAMYQRARKLAVLSNTNELAQYFLLAEQQLEALAVSSNALSLLDQKDAWIILSIAPEGSGARQSERKRRRLTRHIPEDRFASGKRDSEIVKLSDIIAECALLSAQMDLVRRDPGLLHSSGEYRTAYYNPNMRD